MSLPSRLPRNNFLLAVGRSYDLEEISGGFCSWSARFRVNTRAEHVFLKNINSRTSTSFSLPSLSSWTLSLVHSDWHSRTVLPNNYSRPNYITETQIVMTATYIPRQLAATTRFRYLAPATSSFNFSRGLADQIFHRPNKSSAEGAHTFNLKKLGATPTVRVVIYGALGIAAIAETTFWCSWLWSKAFKRVAYIREDQA